jgi:uncharacterized protein YbjT (DUF2867 family)
MADGLIAVTGATGVVGRKVAELLAARGIAQRLVVRDPARAPQLPGTEVRQIADYGHADDVRRELDGVDTLYLVPAQEAADRLQRHFAAVDAAVAAGVRKITYLSFVAASEGSTFTLGRDHWATEQRVRASGAAWTFPRMNLYLDFLPRMVTEAGAVEGPAGDGRRCSPRAATTARRTTSPARRRSRWPRRRPGCPPPPASTSSSATRPSTRRTRHVPSTVRRTGRSRPGSARTWRSPTATSPR